MTTQELIAAAVVGVGVGEECQDTTFISLHCTTDVLAMYGLSMLEFQRVHGRADWYSEITVYEYSSAYSRCR